MRMLYLTLADIDDRSYGGAIRSHQIREALLQVGEVDTLVIHGAPSTRLDTEWQPGRVKRALYARGSGRLHQLGQRLAIRRHVAAVVRAGGYDVIVARYIGLALFVPLRAWTRLVVDADDMFKSISPNLPVSLRVRAALGLRNFAARLALTRAAHVWYVHPADGARLKARALSWVPNTVLAPDAGRARQAPVPGRILMVGYFDHPPNARGLLWFATEVLPSLVEEFPQVELHVVGRYPSILAATLHRDAIHFHGFVDALAAEYDRAALVVAPIQSGGGTQIKVIDALVHGRPLVASRFAHAGFDRELTDGLHLRVADAAAAWVRQCAELLRDPQAAEAMAERGRCAVAAGGLQRVNDTVRDTVIDIAGRGADGQRTASA
jgi:glycosyltransferase involved in cell wall biosynthesis